MPIDGKVAAQRTWGASPAGRTSAKQFEPGTREFFDRALAFRSEREQPWLAGVIPFKSMSGKRVLEIGFGAGYDALRLLQAKAEYTGVDITAENSVRTRRHLAFYGLSPNVMQADAENLPFGDATFDVVYSNGVLHHVPDIKKAFRQVRRVLRPGGEFHVLLYHRNSIFFRLSVTARAFIDRTPTVYTLSGIEYNTAGVRPLVNVYSRRELRRLLAEANLTATSIKVRKLLHEDLPLARRAASIYRAIPQRCLDIIGHAFGWYVIGSATKVM